MTETINTTLRIPPDLDRKLRILAAANDLNKHSQIIRLIREATKNVEVKV